MSLPRVKARAPIDQGRTVGLVVVVDPDPAKSAENRASKYLLAPSGSGLPVPCDRSR